MIASLIQCHQLKESSNLSEDSLSCHKIKKNSIDQICVIMRLK